MSRPSGTKSVFYVDVLIRVVIVMNLTDTALVDKTNVKYDVKLRGIP